MGTRGVSSLTFPRAHPAVPRGGLRSRRPSGFSEAITVIEALLDYLGLTRWMV